MGGWLRMSGKSFRANRIVDVLVGVVITISSECVDNYQETRNVFESVLIELKKFVSVDPKVIITDKDYALRGAIKSVFKDTTILLCTWHATQSVFVKARTLFNHDEATSIEKKMEGIFLEADVQKCETQFTNLISELGEESQMSDYLLTNWWAHKEIVCACYTKQFHRFGTTTTGLCEGQHAALKSFLGTAKYSLSSAFNLIVQHTELRYQRVRTQETTELLNSPTFTRQTRFYGLPCRCQITRFMKNGLPLPLETVHPCWHLQNRDAVTRPPQEVNASQLSDLESTIAEIRAAIIPQPAEDRRTLLEELKTFSSGLRQPSSLKTGTPRKTQSTKRYQTLAERVRSRRIANSPSLLRNSLQLTYPPTRKIRTDKSTMAQFEKKRAAKAMKPSEKKQKGPDRRKGGG
ncbi:hypothetical protein BLNAU_10197 [Blattamonas nauphoetae]|uniref:MULE transposase domain-containing protein n=1 Tax=Blattamonas nauphoetae TaxID=2049346 RepID=A0ABQ9XTR5_9EUKA|nr:hypothetical protein BLNAU_10197 [Blattamonas nauphoetae]